VIKDLKEHKLDLESKVEILEIERNELAARAEELKGQVKQLDQMLCPIYERIKLYLSEFIRTIETEAENANV
jgi:predicted nuclease with TOPRIM domain